MIWFTFFYFNMFAFGEFEEKYFAFLEGLPGKKEENNNDSFCFGKNTDTLNVFHFYMTAMAINQIDLYYLLTGHN